MELQILIAILGIALAVGVPRYAKEGLWGVVVGMITAVCVVVIGGAVLIGGLGLLSTGHEKLGKFALYRALTSTIRWLFRLLMFIGFAAFVWMIFSARFDLEHLWHHKFILVMSLVTGALLFVAHHFLRETFWPVFRMVGGGLLAGLFGAVIGLLLGGPSVHAGPLKAMDLGAVGGVVIYIGLLCFGLGKRGGSTRF